ncbi:MULTISPECIES: MarR family winged helix-turn-helix transcriptional regulator [unclassified Paenibacillus]|uniref:MarR family winged helix-turn-helix transcriptional regulator n=1 Tax=unclassified Paenibacillus TaxID=185978 RepID=UPI003639DB84
MAESSSGSYELAILLGLSFSVVIDELHQRLAGMDFDDVRPAHGFLFQRIAARGATGNEVAEHLGISKQAASQMIDYLERKGYVARQPLPQDGRGKLVVLSERGWACVRATESIFSEMEQRWTSLLGVERVDMLRLDLRRLVMSTGDGKTPPRFRPVW